MTNPIRTLVAGAATLHHEDPVLEPAVALDSLSTVFVIKDFDVES